MNKIKVVIGSLLGMLLLFVLGTVACNFSLSKSFMNEEVPDYPMRHLSPPYWTDQITTDVPEIKLEKMYPPRPKK